MGKLKMIFLHLCLFLALFCLANGSYLDHHAEHQVLRYDSLNTYQKRAENISAENTKSFRGLSQSAVENAKRVVDAALVDWATYNKARFENPKHNVYSPTPESVSGSQKREETGPVLDSPDISEDVANAAALLAEIDAASGFRNGTVLPPLKKRAGGSFWMETMSRSGSQPYGGDNNYKVNPPSFPKLAF